MNKSPRIVKSLLGCCVLTLCLWHCRQEPGKGPSSSAKQMRLGSGYTEIVVNSTKVPGYWAGEIGTGERFFIYTLDGSFKKGDVISVEGAYGSAWAAVFDETTRVYQSNQPTNIFVVWKAARSEPRNDARSTAAKVREK